MHQTLGRIDRVSVGTNALILVALVSVQVVAVVATDAVVRLMITTERVRDGLTVLTRANVLFARIADLVVGGLATFTLFLTVSQAVEARDGNTVRA